MSATIVTIAGRSLLALLFILAGAATIAGPQPFLDHMALLLGWRLPFSAGALALFCVATAFGFHLNLADKAERTLFIKDLAIAGALMVIAAHGSVALNATDLGAITAATNQ
jgi:putative oxidoreductase